jgi:hypothetical protein
VVELGVLAKTRRSRRDLDPLSHGERLTVVPPLRRISRLISERIEFESVDELQAMLTR